MSELEKFLIRCRRQLRLRRLWLDLQRTLWIPALAGLGIQLVGRLIPIPQLWFWTILPALSWLAALPLFTLLKRTSLMRVARAVDLELDLKERLSTALTFQNPASNTDIEQPDPTRTALIHRQHSDALIHAAAILPAQAFPAFILKKHLAAATGLLVLTLLSAWLPNRMDFILQERLAAQQTAHEQAAEIEQLKKEIETAQELTPENRAELVRQLEELAKMLRENPGDLEQALADLSRFEEQIRSKLDPDHAGKEAFQASLAAQLSRIADQKSDSSSPDSAQDALESLVEQLDSMSEEQRNQAARALAQLAAQASQAGDPQLSQAITALAQSMLNGDGQAASQAAQAAQDALQSLDQQLADRAAAQRLLDQAQTSRQALAQTARQFAQGQSGSQGSNQILGPGQGQRPGQGGGSQARTLPPATGGKGNVRPQGSAPAAQTGALDTQVYAPWQRPSPTGEELFIPGQDTGEGQTTTTEGQGPQPGLNNPALMPYSQVYFQYLNTANQAIQQGAIPPSLAEYIRQYFSSLEPQ